MTNNLKKNNYTAILGSESGPGLDLDWTMDSLFSTLSSSLHIDYFIIVIVKYFVVNKKRAGLVNAMQGNGPQAKSWLVRILAAFLVLLVAVRMTIKFLNLPVCTKPM